MLPPKRSTRSARPQITTNSSTPSVNLKLALLPTASVSLSNPQHTSISTRTINRGARLTPEQVKYMKTVFQRNVYPTTAEKAAIAVTIGRCIKTVNCWFQNARGRTTTRRRSTMPGTVTLFPATYSKLELYLANGSTTRTELFSSNDLNWPSSDFMATGGSVYTPYNKANEPHDLGPNIQIKSQELWEHLPSSPPSTCSMASPDLGRGNTNFGVTDCAPLGTSDRRGDKRKTLEWACEQQSKCLKVDRDDIHEESRVSSGPPFGLAIFRDGNLIGPGIPSKSAPRTEKSTDAARLLLFMAATKSTLRDPFSLVTHDVARGAEMLLSLQTSTPSLSKQITIRDCPDPL